MLVSFLEGLNSEYKFIQVFYPFAREFPYLFMQISFSFAAPNSNIQIAIKYWESKQLRGTVF